MSAIRRRTRGGYSGCQRFESAPEVEDFSVEDDDPESAFPDVAPDFFEPDVESPDVPLPALESPEPEPEPEPSCFSLDDVELEDRDDEVVFVRESVL